MLNHELLIAKFRLKLKNVEKTTRPFRYDLKQIPYDFSAFLSMGRSGIIEILPEMYVLTVEGTVSPEYRAPHPVFCPAFPSGCTVHG